jgi:hypothetical protein
LNRPLWSLDQDEIITLFENLEVAPLALQVLHSWTIDGAVLDELVARSVTLGFFVGYIREKDEDRLLRTLKHYREDGEVPAAMLQKTLSTPGTREYICDHHRTDTDTDTTSDMFNVPPTSVVLLEKQVLP